MTTTTTTVPAPKAARSDDGAGGSEPASTVGGIATPRKSGCTTQAIEQKENGVVLRKPVREDGYSIHQLISQCPPLDLNSVYTYLLLSEHFSQSSVVAERDGQLNGFISAYIHPEHDDVLFVWQVAVHERARGASLGRRMLKELLARPSLRAVRYIETTVGPDNAASRRMFGSLADVLGADVTETALFDAQLFGPEGHDDERLIRIGPIVSNINKEIHYDH